MDYNITWRKKDKGWQCIISYKDNFGKWKQKSKQGFKTQKEGKPIIDKLLKELKKEVKNNIDSNIAGITFKEANSMFLEHVELYREYNTINNYKYAFAKFKGLENKKMKSIKKYDIQKNVNEFLKEGLKYSTIKNYLARLTVFLKYVKEELKLITEVPTENIKLPVNKTTNNKKALTKKELNNLLDKLRDDKYYIVAFIAGNTGMRLGEILGLTWADLNETDMLLDVNKQWKKSLAKVYGFGTLKSKNSNRNIPISTKVVKILLDYKKNNPTDIYNRIAPFNSTTIKNILTPRIKKIAGISIHELRHTYATLLISSGIDFKTVASILGHDVKMTMATYAHVNDDMIKNAAEKINEIF